MATHTVHCRSPNGVTLRLHEVVEGPLGIKEHRVDPKSKPVTLSCGDNEVDAEFWARWLEHNAESSLIASGELHVVGGE